ncbi:isochorismatase family protein [Chryseobacterium carnipullorum]|uniref:isochorismatase family protein n=1 Tax=Chryseobacterium carnipullorum TaxID=1124835 RepID=UPI0023F14A5A|nr:isochorismatase family protein [Chryseobacterium carnipullorum]
MTATVAFLIMAVKNLQGWENILKEEELQRLPYVCGVAADFCVYYTANDALDLGFKSSIIERASKPIDVKRYESVKADFQLKGGFII